MAVPKGRRTKSKQGHRRSHLSLKKVTLSKCKRCGNSIMPHQTCKNCGTYKGRQIIDVMAKLSKREKKEKAKELEQQRAQQPIVPGA